MLKDRGKLKILSASAVALIALTGTAYGTGIIEDTSVNDEYSEESQEEQDSEELESEELESEEQESEAQDSEEEIDSEEQDSEEELDSEEEQDSEEEIDSEEQDSEEEVESEEQDASEEQEEGVDEERVVPHGELPIDEETGLLDFPEYHNIAKGRALPRPMTEEEEEYFIAYVEEGQYEEVRTSVTGVEYNLIRVYPEEFYVGDTPVLKYHKFVEIRSELYTLEDQEAFLAEQEEFHKMSLEIGDVYDEELGTYVGTVEESEYIRPDITDFDDLPEDETIGSDTPIENENPSENRYFEEKEVLENLSDYDSMTEDEFKEAYGFNFLFRAVLEEGGFSQEEYELSNGLTLVVEAESLKTGDEFSEDTVLLRWGVVNEVVRFNSTIENTYEEGMYNLVTNVNSPWYVEGNVLQTGHETLRDNGKYTPKKVLVEYMHNQIPHQYLMVADAIHVGDSLPSYSDIVGYIEYGWELGYDEDDYDYGDDTGTQDPDTDNEDTEGGIDDGTDGDTGDGVDDGTNIPTTPEDDENKGEGSGVNDGDLEGSDDDNLDEDGTDRGQQGSDSALEEGEEGKQTDSEETEGRFQQTGTSIIWGSILAGLGLGAIGTYLFKKSNKKGSKEGDDVNE